MKWFPPTKTYSSQIQQIQLSSTFRETGGEAVNLMIGPRIYFIMEEVFRTTVCFLMQSYHYLCAHHSKTSHSLWKLLYLF